MGGFGSFGPCLFLVLSMVLRPLFWPSVVCLNCAPQFFGLSGLAVNLQPIFLRCLACWIVLRNVIPRTVLFGFGFVWFGGILLTLPTEIYAVVFFFEGLIRLCSYSFWRRSNFFKAVERLQFLTRVDFFFKIYSFFARGVSCLHFFTKKGTFNHCGRSEAWKSTHHGRYVFQTAFFREK